MKELSQLSFSMAQPIKLDSIDGMPGAVLETLEDFRSDIENCNSFDTLLDQNELRQVAINLNQICLDRGVVGVHYTRAIRVEIETNGLSLSTGDGRRRAFLDQYGHLFTRAQLTRVEEIWEAYFNSKQKKIRDNLLWFAFTLIALENGGASRLLNYFGGEQIYMPLTSDSEIGAILKTLGEPLIVRCNLKPQNLKTFSDYPWGKIWLSTYHLSQNPNAYQFDVDAYQLLPVLPADIVITKPEVDWLT